MLRPRDTPTRERRSPNGLWRFRLDADGAGRRPVASDHRPLTFYGQLPLAGEPDRTAYIFINESDNAQAWAALGDGNAVVVQPGPLPHLRTVERAT
jgi:hypothetical protein